MQQSVQEVVRAMQQATQEVQSQLSEAIASIASVVSQYEGERDPDGVSSRLSGARDGRDSADQ